MTRLRRMICRFLIHLSDRLRKLLEPGAVSRACGNERRISGGSVASQVSIHATNSVRRLRGLSRSEKAVAFVLTDSGCEK
jgi:hypothetical protein